MMIADPTSRRKDGRSEEHTSELQSRQYLVCRLLHEKKKQQPFASLIGEQLQPAAQIAVDAGNLLVPDAFDFFFKVTATTELYTLSLHDALPIYRPLAART